MFRPFTHIVVTNDTLITQRYINEVLRPEDITFLVGQEMFQQKNTRLYSNVKKT